MILNKLTRIVFFTVFPPPFIFAVPTLLQLLKKSSHNIPTYLRVICNDAVFAYIDPMFVTKLISNSTFWTFTKTHCSETKKVSI